MSSLDSGLSFDSLPDTFPYDGVEGAYTAPEPSLWDRAQRAQDIAELERDPAYTSDSVPGIRAAQATMLADLNQWSADTDRLIGVSQAQQNQINAQRDLIAAQRDSIASEKDGMAKLQAIDGQLISGFDKERKSAADVIAANKAIIAIQSDYIASMSPLTMMGNGAKAIADKIPTVPDVKSIGIIAIVFVGLLVVFKWS